MKKVLISFGFDDSCLSTYANAYPVLKSNGLTGCLSVVTDFVGKEGRYSWESIREMTDNGWEVVSHTRTHDMWDLTPKKIQNEIIDSRRILRERGFPARIFITPGGPWQEKQPGQFAAGTPFDRTVRQTYDGFINGERHPMKLPTDPYAIGRYGCECYNLEQYNRTIREIKEEIDRSVEEGDWCHLGWHDVQGRHIETFLQTVEHIRKYLDSGKMTPSTVSQAIGL